MATYSFSSMYTINPTLNPAVFTLGIIFQGGPVGDGAVADGQLTPGEVLTVPWDISPWSYVGQTPQGIVLRHSFGAPYALLTDSSSPSMSQSVTSSVFSFCFVRGTHVGAISRKGEEICVEDIRRGMTVNSVRGDAVCVKWIGRMTIDPIAARLEGSLPIKITAGAISEGMPSRDLFVSPDHAVLVDGHLVHASALVNGVTIIQMEDWDGPVEYYHIETEKHELILAEGLPAETFIDNVSREQFDNYAEYEALYPNAPPMEELDLPRVMFRRQLPKAIAKRLDARIDALMGPRDRSAPSTPALPAINLREPVPSVHV